MMSKRYPTSFYCEQLRRLHLRPIARISLLLCVWGIVSACERPLKVSLNDTPPPTFTFSGSGEIERIYIFQVTADGKVPPIGSAFWELIPQGVVETSSCPPITYGTVPSGFYQRTPKNGTPPKLEEGKIYGFGAVTRKAPGGDVWFTIRNGKAMRVQKTDPADADSR